MIYQYLWFFFLYAFLGWCSEVIFAAVKSGKFVNRGFLHGPVCPIYGLGVSAVIFALTPVVDNLALLYLGSVLVTSALELVTGWAMEKLFHQKWWDYSEMPFNIGGYVCLAFSLAWGVLCVLIMRVVHPLIEGLVRVIPQTLGIVLLGVFGATLLFDLVMTLLEVVHFNRHLRQLDELAVGLDELSCRIGEGMSDGAIALRDKAEPVAEELRAKLAESRAKSAALKEELSKRYTRLLRAFPDMKSSLHPGTLETLKAELAQKWEARKAEQKQKK